MSHKRTDIDIAQSNEMHHIKKIAANLNIQEDDLEMYGKYKAKLPLSFLSPEKISKSNLILLHELIDRRVDDARDDHDGVETLVILSFFF